MPVASKRTVTITLPTDREFTITRVFDAPREAVFDALTSPELLRRWFGPPPERGWTVTTCETDLQVGGVWRIDLRSREGAEIILRGTYREILRPERIVATQLMEGCEGQGAHEAVATTVLAESGNRTTFAQTIRYPSMQVRDSVLRSGASEESLTLVYDKLADLLAADM